MANGRKNLKQSAIIVLLVAVCSLGIKAVNGFSKNKQTPSATPTNNSHKQTSSTDNRQSNGEKKIFSLENLLPSDEDGLVLYDRKYYRLGYNNKHKQAGWVAWLLTRQMMQKPKMKRQNNFRTDEDLDCCYSTTADYNRSGYDKGHLCPSGDMNWSKDAMNSTFLMSNMSPQVQKFNQRIWEHLERKERQWAEANDSILIIAGPLLNKVIDTIGNNKVSVPYAYFKIVVDISYPTYKAIGFVMENKNLKGSIFSYATSVRQIEELTHLNFFPDCDNDSLIQSLETTFDTLDWK